MQNINIIYIDDMIDPIISKHLSLYKQESVNINYDEVKFDIDNGYESLIADNRVREANVIFIDSQLFQNSTASNGKYTGEQFKLILRKVFPYIEVIVITQNEVSGEFSSTISKYSQNDNEKADTYYNRTLPKYIEEAIKRICEYREIVSVMESDSKTSVLIEKINNSLAGKDTYDELTKSDIDYVVGVFKELQEKLNV